MCAWAQPFSARAATRLKPAFPPRFFAPSCKKATPAAVRFAPPQGFFVVKELCAQPPGETHAFKRSRAPPFLAHGLCHSSPGEEKPKARPACCQKRLPPFAQRQPPCAPLPFLALKPEEAALNAASSGSFSTPALQGTAISLVTRPRLHTAQLRPTVRRSRFHCYQS